MTHPANGFFENFFPLFTDSPLMLLLTISIPYGLAKISPMLLGVVAVCCIAAVPFANSRYKYFMFSRIILLATPLVYLAFCLALWLESREEEKARKAAEIKQNINTGSSPSGIKDN